MWDKERIISFDIKEGDSISVVTYSCTEISGILLKININGISIFTDNIEVMVLYDDIEFISRNIKSLNVKSLFKN